MVARDTRKDVIKKVLPNGLMVLVKEDHSSPVVGINVWFRVGSVNETDEMTGLAHFQEHMVFKGTEKLGVGEIANIIKSAGGNLNAATSYSYTMYYVVLPADAFALGLEVQADAMMNSTFDPEEFKKERLVVIDEARMYDDTPDSFTFYRTMELGYQVHNYRRPIAGYQDVVEKFTRDQLVEFYQRYYRPGNAILVIVGDVRADEAFAAVDNVYGIWKNGRSDPYQSPVEPAQKEFRFRTLRGHIDHAYTGIGFHVPDILHDDYPALEMLATLLGHGKSSRLRRKLREEKHLVTSVSASLLAEKWPGYFMLFASTPVEKWDEARDAIFDEVGRFQNEPVEEVELVKARRQLEKTVYSELETVEGQASNLGYYEVLGDFELAERHREAIGRVTAEEIGYVAKKYFRADNCSMISYLPDDAGNGEPDIDAVESAIARRLASGPTETAALASKRLGPAVSAGSPNKGSDARRLPVERRELDSGLKVLVKPRKTVPMVSILAVYQGGVRLEGKGQSGLSTLGTRALLKGTPSFSAEEIVERIEGLGGGIESFSGFDVSGVYLNILTDRISEALPIFREVLREPSFPPERVEKEKDKLLEELAKRHDHPVYFSVDKLFENVFGDHPYGHPFVGREEELRTFSDSDCRSWYRRILAPANITLVLVGDVTPDVAMDVARELFDDLEAAPVPTPEFEAPIDPVHAGHCVLRRPQLKQAVTFVGFTAPPMMTDEAISLGVLNGIMTGLGGRLFVELRDKRSLGYMTGSAFSPLRERSIFYGYANPGPEGIDEAIGVILAELGLVTREKVTDEELGRAKQWLIGSQQMKLQRNLSQAMEYGVYEALGFGYDTVERTAELVRSVTKERIMDAASKTFDPGKAVIIKLLPEE